MVSLRRVLLIPAVTAAALLAGGTALAGDAKGTVDWEKREITATGAGAPDLRAPNTAAARLGAERAAKLDAMRNILETLKGVQVTSGESAGGLMEANSGLKSRVQGVLRNFEVVATRYYSDGGVEVDVKMKLDGELAKALLPPAMMPNGGECKDGSTTGLVVDATGRSAIPALAPRIVDEAGKEVFGPAKLDPEAASTRGVAAYAKTVNEAKGSERVGCAPLLMKAVRAEGSDIVISAADASALQKATSTDPFLAQGRVMIVID